MSCIFFVCFLVGWPQENSLFVDLIPKSTESTQFTAGSLCNKPVRSVPKSTESTQFTAEFSLQQTN